MGTKKTSAHIMCAAVFVLMGFSACPAEEITKNVDVRVVIPQQNGLTVSVSKVTGGNRTPVASVDFGSLIYDEDRKLFREPGDSCYEVDVDVNSNAADWTLTHKAASISNGSRNLDHNINVAFLKRMGQSDEGSPLLAVMSYAASNNAAFTKTQLGAGSLRVRYSLATGDKSRDAGDVVPIELSQATGTYQGMVTFTLTQ